MFHSPFNILKIEHEKQIILFLLTEEWEFLMSVFLKEK